MTELSVQNVGFDYDGRPLLDNVSFSVKTGEQVFLVGPSGTGKSTMLRIIAGLEPPREGSLTWGQQSLLEVPAHERNIGMLFQEPALFPHMNVQKNVAFGLPYSGIAKEQWEGIVQEELARVGLEGRGLDHVDELSGGQRSRVALARTLACRPRMVLLDEPFAALDRSLREKLGPEVRTLLKEQSIAGIWVTHDEVEAAELGDRVLRYEDHAFVET